MAVPVRKWRTAEEDGWRVHELQEPALREADERSEQVWAVEVAQGGRRKFIVASRNRFWRRYRRLRPEFRHYYEVVRAHEPCHLYLDLEYYTQVNAGRNGPRMVATLRRELLAALWERYERTVAPDDVVELDSSSPSKFSRHLIVRVAGCAFADNSHAGSFVRSVCNRLLARSRTEPELAELWVRPPPPPQQPPAGPAALSTSEGAAKMEAVSSGASPPTSAPPAAESGMRCVAATLVLGGGGEAHSQGGGDGLASGAAVTCAADGAHAADCADGGGGGYSPADHLGRGSGGDGSDSRVEEGQVAHCRGEGGGDASGGGGDGGGGGGVDGVCGDSGEETDGSKSDDSPIGRRIRRQRRQARAAAAPWAQREGVSEPVPAGEGEGAAGERSGWAEPARPTSPAALRHGCADGSGPWTPFVDLSVYTRNRCFRLYKSSKLGKREELTPAWLSPTELAFLPHEDEAKLFMASLITNVPEGATLLTCGGAALPPTCASQGGGSAGCGQGETGILAAPLHRAAPATPAAVKPCPLPVLESFMLQAWARKTGLPTATRAWSIDHARGTLSLALAPSNRWCSRLGRPHRSNGTLLVAVLTPRVGEPAFFTQRCFDAECRAAGFRGGDRLPLPERVVACSLGSGDGDMRGSRDDFRLGCDGCGTEPGLCPPAVFPAPSSEGLVGHGGALRATAAKRQRTPPPLGEVRGGGRTPAAGAREQTPGELPWSLHGEAACWKGTAAAACAEDWWDEEAEAAVAGAARELQRRREHAQQVLLGGCAAGGEVRIT